MALLKPPNVLAAVVVVVKPVMGFPKRPPVAAGAILVAPNELFMVPNPEIMNNKFSILSD